MNNDRLSELPDDTLWSILSYLQSTDIVRTGVISRKWQRMWRYVPVLKFEDQKEPFSASPTAQERTNFVSFVNGVLEKHLASVIDEFKIKFSLNKSKCEDHVNKWVIFAISKQVKKLEVDLMRIDATQGLCTLDISLVNVKLSLTSLTLKDVNVKGRQIENFLRRCPLLDKLCIRGSDILIDVTIYGSSLPLKYLKISHCRNFKTMDIINAPKLVSLIYEGKTIRLRVIQAPLLSKVAFGRHIEPVWFALDDSSLPNYFSQLKELDLAINLEEEAYLRIKHVPVLVNLRHLRLRIMGHNQSCLGWVPLIEASPVLAKLSLDVCNIHRYHIPKNKSKCGGGRLESLKTLELRAPRGFLMDLELISYVFDNAITLEDVIVLPYGEFWPSIPKADLVKLEKLLPTGVKLTIN